MKNNNVISAGRTALITGSSSGIGAAFAQRLAKTGMSLVLVARNPERLATQAAELATSYRVQAHPIALDISAPESISVLATAVNRLGIDIDLLINNAGIGAHGIFTELALEKQQAELALNVRALVETTYAFVPGMQQRGYGAVINVASTAGFQPLPYMAIYGATKAFVLSFTEALAVENAKTGVQFQVLCPGNTETPFHDAVGSSDGRVGAARTPEQVVTTSLAALAQGKVVAIDGVMNALLAQSPRILPRAVAARIAGHLMRPR